MGHGCSTDGGGSGGPTPTAKHSTERQQTEPNMQHSAVPSQLDSFPQDVSSNEHSRNDLSPPGSNVAGQSATQHLHLTAFTIAPATTGGPTEGTTPSMQPDVTDAAGPRVGMQQPARGGDDDEFDLPSLSSAVDVEQMPTNLRLRME